MRTSSKSAWAALLAALVAGCTPPADPRPPVNLSLRLKFKGSCGTFAATSYDTSCMAALRVLIRDENGEVLVPECVPLSADERPGDLGQLIFADEALVRMRGISTNRSVSFEVTGLHDVDLPDGGDVCESSADKNRWLFWGRSDVIDLRRFDSVDAGPAIAEVTVECRDCTFACGDQTCFGCPGVGSAACPAPFPPSFCIPVDVNCARLCVDDDDCFGGRLSCDEQTRRCVPGSEPGGLCAPCQVGDAGVVEGCGDGFTCVSVQSADRRQGFCAPSCPEESCPPAAKCNRLGNDLFPVAP